MAYNKIIYDQKVLIDLTNDTVTEDRLLAGVTAHDKSGNTIRGSLLQGHPEVFVLEETLEDEILDSNSEPILGWCIYDLRK